MTELIPLSKVYERLKEIAASRPSYPIRWTI